MKRFIASIMIGMFMFTGCAMITELSKEPILVQYAIQKAVRVFLGGKPHIWAQKTYDITTKAIEELDRDYVITVGSLKSHVKEQINWNELYPEDQMIVNLLIDSIETEINGMIAAEELPEDVEMKMKEVLIWVQQVVIPLM